MKKNYLYVVLLLSVFAACQKDDNRIFSESADQRLNKIIASYQQALNSSPNGWKAVLTPGNEVPYNFYFRFTDSNRVVIYADFDSATAGDGKESSYRLKALQQPSLIFDTYSAIHKLSDPDERVNGGARGGGLTSDFEFMFDRVVGDTIKLIGRINKTKLSLVKATKQEADFWQNKTWKQAIVSLQNLGKILNYFKRLTVNGREYEVILDQFNRVAIFTWVDAGGVTRTFVTEYKFSPSPTGITFNMPFNTGNGITIPGFYGISFDPVTSIMSLNVGNNVGGTIAGAIKPISTDLTAPSRWWNRSVTADNYWVSFNGFTVNGVPDAFGVRKIPGFQFLLFWAQYNVSGGITYDLLGFVANNSLGYGLAFRPPTFTSDGRIKFPFLGTLGTVPASATSAVTNTRTMMSDTSGYYFVQTGQDVFDMVSAKDAKSWITWEW